MRAETISRFFRVAPQAPSGLRAEREVPVGRRPEAAARSGQCGWGGVAQAPSERIAAGGFPGKPGCPDRR